VDNAGYIIHLVRLVAKSPFRTAIGMRVKDGVVLAVEKLVTSKLLLPGANRRIQTVDRHMGLV
jgi:20S proteasome alpha/beta subunit